MKTSEVGARSAGHLRGKHGGKHLFKAGSESKSDFSRFHFCLPCTQLK